MRAPHDGVDVAVEVAVDGVGAAGGEGAAEERGEREPEAGQAVGRYDHRREGGHEQQLDDAGLGQRDVGGERAAPAEDAGQRLDDEGAGRRAQCGALARRAGASWLDRGRSR